MIRLRTPHARALEAALEPDNLQAPRGVMVVCEVVGETLKCMVSVHCAEPRGVLTLRNTVDDLLASLKAALEALEASRAG